MIEYVVGFCFDAGGEQVVTIQKLRGPPSVKGRRNGVGGKIEDGEVPEDAMVREFEEEAGLRIPHRAWTLKVLLQGDGYVVFVFVAFTSRIGEVRSMTDEQISVVDVFPLPDDVVRNLHWMIPLCLNRYVREVVVVEEQDERIERVLFA